MATQVPIAARQMKPLFTMLAGLEQLLTREQFRDLLAYFQNLK